MKSLTQLFCQQVHCGRYIPLLQSRIETQIRAAFTLVEIIVTIAIIGILSTLLLTGISSLRVKGEQASCANSLRQACQAVLLYAGANDNRLPASISGVHYWGDPLVEDGYLTTDFMQKACPTSARELGYIGTLAYNYTVLGNESEDAVGSIRAASVDDLSQTCMLMDGFNLSTYGGLKDDPENVLRNGQQIVFWDKAFIRPDGKYFPIGHGNTLNVAFCDGHVEVVKKKLFYDKEKAANIFRPTPNQPFQW